MAGPRRILVRGVNWLGDAVMSTPALLRLREALPGAHITLLTRAKLAEIWQGHPAIDAVECFEDGENIWRVGRRLRAGKFDTGLVLPNSPRSALELWLGGIPGRVGYAGSWRKWWLTRIVPARPSAVEMHKRSIAEINRLIRSGLAVSREVSPLHASTHPNSPPLRGGGGEAPAEIPVTAHHLYQYLHLAAALGARPEPLAPVLAVSGAAVREFVVKFGLETNSSAAMPWLGLNAGAEYGPAKRWPEERFIEAAIKIQRRLKCRWLVFGVQAEAGAAERIATKIRQAAGNVVETNPAVVNLAGKTSLGELCAGLKLCRVVLTNDSGPTHAAAALGTPVVVPFGSTSPELTGPGLPGDGRHQMLRAGVPCSPCFLRECPIDFRCMTGISVEPVVAAVLRAAG